MKKLSNTKKSNNENSNLINTKSINTRIEQEVCNETTHTKYEFLPLNVTHSDETINKLKDTYLLEEYKKCKSVQNKIKKLNY
jgi:hypothetical protein